MSYQPYLIANYATGVDVRLQPWLSPDDAQEELFDGYVYRGEMSKRQGYIYFATGLRDGNPYRESRIIRTLSGVAMVGAINGVNRVYTLAGTAQIARGSVTVAGSNPVQSFTDNGLGFFMDGVSQIGTVNYLTGAISITLPIAPIAASTVTVTYSYMPGNPVMMIATYITASNVKELIVADTDFVNRYDATGNILEDISPAGAYTGDETEFFTWVNYADPAGAPRLLFCNNNDVIQEYDGSTVANYAYTSATITTLLASFMVQMKDRLILLRTTENGTVYPRRIRISGTGASCDTFDTTATGAGFIDIPDGSWIFGAAFNRDDLIIFTSSSTWVMKYTGNDTTPFVIERIDESRGSEATFSAITYLNKTTAASPRGLIITDGYRVERQDEVLPDFTFDEVDTDKFLLCFAGSVDADRDHYLLYPTPGQTQSKRILTTNYDEDNYATYRIPMSCMGTYQTGFDITWNDLSEANGYENWDDFANAYSSWNAIAYMKGQPFSLGGGHTGEIWRLNTSEGEDNPVRIRNITVVDDETVEVTTDWNNFGLNTYDPQMGADYIYLTGIDGMVELNNAQYPITEVTSANVFRLNVSGSYIPATSFTSYDSGGTASRVIPFTALFKKFNPFVNIDKKVRCGWLYMYVDTTGTELWRKVEITGINLDDPEVVVVTTAIDHGFETGDGVSFDAIVGTTELNQFSFYITVLSATTFSINDLDATGYTPYVSGGYVAIYDNARMEIDIIRDDVDVPTQLNNISQDPYRGTCSNLVFEDGFKKWYKVFINQTGRFIQFRLRNTQAGAIIKVQATMLGFQPVGRLI